MQTSKLPRARCPKCGREVALRKGGELREHRIGKGQNRYHPLCVASGYTVEAATNLIKAGQL